LRLKPPSRAELDELIRELSLPRAEPRVLALPDFFLDVIVTYGAELARFISDVEEAAGRGGGSLSFKSHRLMRGGNAANTASALAMLGAKVRLATRTSKLGLKLLRLLLPSSVDLSLARGDGDLSTTVALEVEVGGRLCNIMISDPGSLADYGPEDLAHGIHEAIASSSHVCIFNWASNRRGTQLAEAVLREAKEAGGAKTFMDTSDPSKRAEEIPDLIRRVFKRDLLDALSVNENEVRLYAKHVVSEDLSDPLKCAEALHRELGLRVDLHTASYSATLEGGELHLAPSFNVKPLRATGAGDAWNAGDIYGWSIGLRPRLRLLLANAVAAYYISSPNASHPTKPQVADFLRSAAVDSSSKINRLR
jgi:sugar/nucleoside kinase (ribokinase family)